MPFIDETKFANDPDRVAKHFPRCKCSTCCPDDFQVKDTEFFIKFPPHITVDGIDYTFLSIGFWNEKWWVYYRTTVNQSGFMSFDRWFVMSRRRDGFVG